MQQKDYRLAAIMYTDIQGFSRMMEKDERGTLELLEFHNELIRDLSGRYKGEVVKTIGDALLVVFPTTLDAVNCGLDVQNTLAEYNTTSGKLPLKLRIGIHLGDIHFYEDDVLGEGINIASRLQSVAYPGCVCISREVYNNVYNKLHADFRSLGRVNLKNITKEVHAYEIVTANADNYTRTGEPLPDRHETVGNPQPGPAAASTSSAVTGVGAEFDELKAFVIQQIKSAGRRISVSKLRASFPFPGPGFDRAIQKLIAMGYLTNDEPGTQGMEPPQPEQPAGAPPPQAGGPWNWGDWSRTWQQQGWNRDAWRAQAHAMRHAYKHRRHDERHANRDESAGVADQMGDSIPFPYSEYRQKVIDRVSKVRGGLVGHFAPFLIVNGFLFYINLRFGGTYPWFLWPLGGWAIGVVSHYAAARNRRLEKDDVEALPQTLDDADYRQLVGYHKARSGTRSATASMLAVSAFLVLANFLSMTSFPWAVFPIGGLAIGLVSTLASFFFGRGKFAKRLAFLKKNRTTIEAERIAKEGQPDDPPLVRQAIALADSVLAQAKGLGKDKAYLGEDLKPLLESYIGQMRVLIGRSRDVEGIMAAIPRQELDRDLVDLKRRYDSTSSDSLKREYQKTIEQIERQSKSFEELKNQKELMDLKITNSMNSLKQMQLDLARMAGLATAEPSSLDTFKARAQELTSRLEDVVSSYEEVEDIPGTADERRLSTQKLLEEFRKLEQKELDDKGS